MKKQTKSAIRIPATKTSLDTPRFKEAAIHQPIIQPQPQQPVNVNEYFTFGGSRQKTPLKQPPIRPKLRSPTSKSVHLTAPKKVSPNNSFTQDKKPTTPTKVQIFNNNYQFINIQQPKESIQSLQKQFQQILETQQIKQRTYTSPQNYFNGLRVKKTQSPKPKSKF